MPKFNKDERKLPSPLVGEQKSIMYKLSAYAKENELLEGKERKQIYQAARYNDWFLYTFEWIVTILEKLADEISEAEQADLLKQVRDLIETISGGYSTPEIIKLKSLYESGQAEPAEILLLSELLEGEKKYDEAIVIAKRLLTKHPKNVTVQRLFKRLKAKSGSILGSQEGS